MLLAFDGGTASVIGNALLTFYRSLSRHPLFAALNVLGLAVGIGVFLVLTLIVRYESGFDAWLPHAAETYRLDTTYSLPGEIPTEYAVTSFKAYDLLRADFPEIRAATRVYDRTLLVSEGNTLDSENVAYVDPGFFQVIELPALAGDTRQALAPGSAVITAHIAQKYFGTTRAIGRTFQVSRNGTRQTLTVSAILRDLPADTSLKFSIITLLTPAVEDGVNAFARWGSASGLTFLRFDNTQAAQHVQARLRDFVARRASGTDMGAEGLHPETFFVLSLVSIRDAHFHDVSVQSVNVPGADHRVVASLGLIGLLALAMAAINYINLATARSDLRAREVALRKVLGATRRALLVQFLAEAVALVACAALIGLALAELTIPGVNALGGWDITIPYVQLVPGLIVLVVLLGLCAGLYPALLLSAYRPARVLAATRLPAGGSWGTRLRQALVLIQFTGAVTFAISTLVIDAQADLLRNADRGFAREGLVIVKSFGRKELLLKQPAILDALRGVPGVVAATQSDREPDSNSSSESDVRVPGRPGPNPSVIVETVGPDYFKSYGIHLVAGRPFDANRAIDDSKDVVDATPTSHTVASKSAIINESALPVLGYGSATAALGKTFFQDVGNTHLAYTIVGVVGDVRFMSSREPVAAQFYMFDSKPFENAQAAIRYTGAGRSDMMQRLQTAWHSVVPDQPFGAQTADERLEEFYKPDQQHARLFSAGAILAIAIACLGLYGLAAFSTTRRVREIGIRKTLGASTRDVLLLLIGQFVRPVLIANVIAWPLAWAAMRAWLSGFDERVALSPLYFVASGVGALVLSTATVAAQAWRVAHAEPARALRYE